MNTILPNVSNFGKVHVQQFSEFSGAGTAEFALKALASALPDKLSARIMHQSDWNKAAQNSLINNSDADTHVFGDIKEICSDDMNRKTSRRVAVEVPSV